MITKNTIDKVFETARVEEVIGEFVHLKKSGSNFKGLSPFSDERTPSFMVSPVKQIWKDFSSGKGGNVVTFLMEHEHYSYPEAIRYLAKRYNIEIEETQQTEEEKAHADERESMYLLSEYARNYFHDILLNHEKGKAIGLTYFKERGISDESIERFELGYALDEWTAFTDSALSKQYSLDYLQKTGLTIVNGDRKFDRFKGRIIFPIHSMSGRVLGFGGRTLLTDKKVAKYVNSPESDIYHKSKVLYGIFQAKQSIAQKDNCFLVEGYTDVISMSQAGIENVVASSGTALTPDQIRLINRLTENITVLFDGDAAGIRASLRGIDMILTQGMNVKVVAFADGEDPDSFARKHSGDEIREYLEENAQDFIQFKASLLLEDSKNDPVKKASLIRDIVNSISKIPNNIQREVYIQECSRIMDISENVLFSELAQILKKSHSGSPDKVRPISTPVTGVKKETQKVSRIDPKYVLEKKIIEILLLYGNEVVEFKDYVSELNDNGKEIMKEEKYEQKVSDEVYMHLHEDEIEFANEHFNRIYSEIIHLLNQNEEIRIDNFIHQLDSDLSRVVSDLIMDEDRYMLSDWERKDIWVKKKEKNISKLVTDVIYNLRRVLIDEKIRNLKQELTSEQEEISDKESFRTDHLQMIIDYTDLKKLLFEKLNRVI
jgi:DNA primase